MSIGIVEAVIAKIVEKAAQQVAKKATMVVNFTNDIDWLAKKLTTMTDYLQDAETKSSNNELVRKWVQGIRDIAWDAEDILEECELTPVSGVYTYSQLIFRYRMGRRIKDIKARMSCVMKDATELKLVRDLSGSNQQPSASSSQTIRQRRTSILERDSPPIAIEMKVDQFLALLDEASDPVVAVVGMGGIGKTFLLQHVFNRVKERYENAIWLSISQTYSLRKLQSDLAFNIKLKLKEDDEGRVNVVKEKLKEVVRDGISEIPAAEIIHECLEGKTTLVVLDDVWRATRQENLIAELGLPTGGNSQCKVVVTTRSREVCRNMRARVYEMQLLSPEESWELLCFHAFPEQKRPPQYVEKIAREIEKECAKLPLAISTVAASLATKTVRREWEVMLAQLKQVINPNDPIINILKFTYDTLPAPVKPCFVYLSFFPEDEEINCEYLIYLWIAEGFIPQGEDQWEIGWDYLYQLQSVCLVNLDNTRVFKTCTVHDLVLDLALYIFKQNKCAFSVVDAFPNVPNKTGCRRILLPKKGIDGNIIASSMVCSPRFLRTLSLSGNQIENIPASLFSRMTVLRVLDLSHTNISTLSKCVANLKLLKVLNLQKTKIEKVPECIQSLKRLCFLDISWCEAVRRLPVWIGELQFLQHFNIWGCSDEVVSVIPKGISKLLCLRTLKSDSLSLSIEENGVLKLQDVASFIHLQELWLNIKHEVQLLSIERGILDQLIKMRILGIDNDIPQSRTADLPCLPESFTAMMDIELLYLKKFAIPSWICEFTNLKTLYLWNCDGSNYPELEMIPNLRYLNLTGNKSCRNFPKEFGKSGGFPRLHELRMDNFPLLEEFPELESGAMPRLQHMRLQFIPIRNAPIGLEHLKSLKKCEFLNVGAGVKIELREGGEYRKRIRENNPHVALDVK